MRQDNAGLLSSDEGLADLATEQAQAFAPLEGEEAASPEEEEAMAIGNEVLGELLYGDDSLPKIANVFHQDKRSLYEVIPEILFPMLEKAKADIEGDMAMDAPSSVFFAEGGLIQTGLDMVWDLAQQLEIPGSDDPDEYAAALMNMHKRAGEYVLENDKDGTSRVEAAELGGELLAAGEGTDTEGLSKVYRKRAVAAGIDQGVDGMVE